FADVQEKAVGRQDQTPIPTPEQAARLKKLDEELAALRARLATPTPELAAAQAAWENETRAALAAKKPAWGVQPPKQVKSQRGATLTAQPDASVLASGANPDKDVYTVTLTSDLPRLSGLRLEALRHPSLTGGSLSRANGNFVLTGVDVKV